MLGNQVNYTDVPVFRIALALIAWITHLSTKTGP